MPDTFPFEIKNRWTGAVIFTAALAAELKTRARSVQLGAAVKLALATRANLTGADLTDANLTRADLTRADLTGADLTGADLTGADLTDANLTDADPRTMRTIKADLWEILLKNRAEVPGLLAALREGRIDGSTYRGSCACLVGTIANVRGAPVESLEPDSGRPAERWFLAIREGHTPSNHPIAKITEGWIVEFLALTGDAAIAKAEAGR